MPMINMPISNVLLGSDYTGVIELGASKTKLNVILDTGSSTLAVDGSKFNPTTDSGTKTTNIAQEVQYGSGSWVGAVVQTSAGIASTAALNNVLAAVTYQESANMFGNAQGIWGLAYETLNNAYRMPANTWTNKYSTARIQTGKETDLDPYFDQLEQAGIIANKFAFYTKRSIVSAATADPATDPLNQGVFVLGGGEAENQFYTGNFTEIAVLDDIWYNTNLLSVRIGNQPAIAVAPVPPGSPDASNSIVDSGTNSLLIDQDLFNKMLASFNAIEPTFANMLNTYSLANGQGIAQNQVELAKWPNIEFTLQGTNGPPATLMVSPGNYWQFDAGQKGIAIANIFGDGGQLGGMSILGLPLFNEYYTVFDRTLAGGRGVIRFARRR